MDYDQLTDEQKRRICQADLARFEAEHYRHQLAYDTAQAMGDDTAADTAQQNMAVLEQAITVRRDALATLPEPEPKPDGPRRRK